MKKKLTIIFIVIIAISVIVSIVALAVNGGGGDAAVPLDGNVTIVRAPEQATAQWPAAIPDPREFMVQLPESPNLAEGMSVTVSSFHDIYVAANAVDGEATSYWESEGFPAEFTIALDGPHTVQTVAVSLNPSSLWESRTQAFEILVSDDGTNFTTAVAEAPHEFDPLTGNTVRIDFDPASASYVKLIFTSNSAARTQGAQAAEIMIFGG
ncbi:MAG: discoidin domain-containing protein [Oscillospiraceae bacterium]|nr:discoidin domain-containing protein [Oscillospiraceae bacterium]MCL2279085.1 discoidin domain-containing protein [Oscillospiraceae bacterium]